MPGQLASPVLKGPGRGNAPRLPDPGWSGPRRPGPWPCHGGGRSGGGARRGRWRCGRRRWRPGRGRRAARCRPGPSSRPGCGGRTGGPRGTARPRTPGGPRWGTGSCPGRSCDTRSHILSELAEGGPVGMRPRRLRPPGSHLPARPVQQGVARALPDLFARRRPAYRGRFTKGQCQPCPVRAACTTSGDGKRTVGFPPRELYELQVRNRAGQQDPAWHKRYAVRSGIEGTVCELARGHGMPTAATAGSPRPTAARPDRHRSQHRTPQPAAPPAKAHPRDHRRRSRTTSTSMTSSACAHGEPSAKPQQPRSSTESSLRSRRRSMSGAKTSRRQTSCAGSTAMTRTASRSSAAATSGS
jgi:Transposase DDE domain